MRLVNISPLGPLDVPLLGRQLGAGEEFEVDDEQGRALLEQEGVYALAAKPRKPRRPRTPATRAGDTKKETVQ
ncbi:hypothetical protein KMZ30_07295 [Phycicoccus sp. KQZ13P-1]|uniref:hypothetical protein n=1 Tax=Phycicoccus mangrovi TaxID=2840470 RepID=UPI001C00852C|nr:hypothetical protein [Phycicoccus mangrovi]MBT9255376.1 hypothetical protein [Phycicoccus mangrovi]